MSPKWFSTMFPVYIFAGSVLGMFASLILISFLLQKYGILKDDITVEHYHDLAKLSFAFVFFWGYIAFSQFMLIWYADIPEETFWFKDRSFNPYLASDLRDPDFWAYLYSVFGNHGPIGSSKQAVYVLRFDLLARDSFYRSLLHRDADFDEGGSLQLAIRRYPVRCWCWWVVRSRLDSYRGRQTADSGQGSTFGRVT